MDRKKQLKFCKTCKYKKLNLSEGIICALTNKKADFERKCPDYEPDIIALKLKNEELKEDAKAAEGRSKALTVFYFLIAFSILSSIISYIFFRSPETKDIVKDIVKLFIEGGLYYFIFHGKNWARMLLTALLIIAILICLFFIINLLISSQPIILLLMPLVLIYIYIIYFIYGDKDFLTHFKYIQEK